MDTAAATIRLSEGVIESSKYAAGFEWAQNYSDVDMAEIYETDINTVYPDIYEKGGATKTEGVVYLNANDQGVRIHFNIDEKVDSDRDITITFPYSRFDTENDVVPTTKTYKQAKTDGSEVGLTTTWNDIAGPNLPAEVANTYNKYVLTIPAANVNSDSLCQVYWYLDDADGAYYIYNCSVKYYIKRDV